MGNAVYFVERDILDGKMGRYTDYMGKSELGRIECRRGDNGGREPVCIGTGECVRETPDWILVELKRDRQDSHGFVTTKKVGIPKSCLHDNSEVFEQDGTGKVVVMRWFAEKEGFTDAE